MSLFDVAMGKHKAQKGAGRLTNSEQVWNRVNAQKSLMVAREQARLEAEARAQAEEEFRRLHADDLAAAEAEAERVRLQGGCNPSAAVHSLCESICGEFDTSTFPYRLRLCPGTFISVRCL